MFHAYKYLLYRVYAWQVASFGQKENPRFVAIACCSLFLFVNIQTIRTLFEIFSGYRIQTQNIHAVIGIIFLTLLNSYIFLYRNDFEELVKEFSKETESQRKKNTIWCLAYVVFSHIIFFLSVYILNSKRI